MTNVWNNLKEEGFIVAHSFKSFNPQPTPPLLSSLWRSKTSWQRNELLISWQLGSSALTIQSPLDNWTHQLGAKPSTCEPFGEHFIYELWQSTLNPIQMTWETKMLLFVANNGQYLRQSTHFQSTVLFLKDQWTPKGEHFLYFIVLHSKVSFRNTML